MEYKIVEKLLQRHVDAYFKAQRDVQIRMVGQEDVSESIVGLLKGLQSARVKLEPNNLQVIVTEYLGSKRTERLARDTRLSRAETNSLSVRAAICAGIVKELSEDDVDDMEPWLVTKICLEVSGVIKKAYEVPGE